jgi:hypothetical protein
MLRAVVIAVAAILTCVGIMLIAHGLRTPGWQAFGLGLVVLLAALFERWRYRRVGERPDGEWLSTGERFLDPSTGQPVEVLFNPRSGERRYVSGNSRSTSEPPPRA